MTSGADAPPLVIVGASVRALAGSAARAGFCVYAADLFGDHDLRAVAEQATTIEPYPDGAASAIARYPHGPVMYTGAIENAPDVLSQLARHRPLAGASAESVRNVRDPARLARSVRDAGLFFPESRLAPTGLPGDGTWLVKPIASAGGRGIRPWLGQDAGGHPRLWQERVPGCRLSVGYVLRAGKSHVIAASRQLIGRRWCRAGPFAYCGSIDLDMATLGATIASQMERLGDLLVGPFGLIGVIGADLIVDARQRVWVIEINPRPTASMELAERATGASVAAMHGEAFGIEAPCRTECHARVGTWSKAVLFARQDLTFDERAFDSLTSGTASWAHDDGWPAVADIPAPPCAISTGSPVCTVFARGPSPHAALCRVRDRVAMVEKMILGR